MLDDFAGSGSLSGNWSGFTWEYNRASGILDPNNSAYASIFWNASSFSINQEAYITFPTAPTGAAGFGLAIHCLDAGFGSEYSDGAILAEYNASLVGGVAITASGGTGGGAMGSVTVSFANGDQFGLAYTQSDSRVYIYKNGSSVGSVDLSGWSLRNSTGYIGIRVAAPGAATGEDFGGGSTVAGVTTRIRDMITSDGVFPKKR